MYLIAALGNPGKSYEQTRHNVAWLLLEETSWEIDWNTNKANTIAYCKTAIGAEEVELIKPLTYMNRSGEAVRAVRDKHELSNTNIVVIHDDIDLALGAYKITFDRGDAGHNGVASIREHLKSKQFVRLRIGVARTSENGSMIKPNVLDNFTDDEIKKIQKLVPTIEQSIETIVKSGLQEAMNTFNEK